MAAVMTGHVSLLGTYGESLGEAMFEGGDELRSAMGELLIDWTDCFMGGNDVVTDEMVGNLVEVCQRIHAAGNVSEHVLHTAFALGCDFQVIYV